MAVIGVVTALDDALEERFLAPTGSGGQDVEGGCHLARMLLAKEGLVLGGLRTLRVTGDPVEVADALEYQRQTKSPNRWREVNAIIEATEHDNSCVDADQAPECDYKLIVNYDALEAVSVQDAIAWANSQPYPVTLFLYDSGGGFADG